MSGTTFSKRSISAGQVALAAVRQLFRPLPAPKPTTEWPECEGCGHSCTGRYGGVIRCTRCTPRTK
jgi:hypothetical protein